MGQEVTRETKSSSQAAKKLSRTDEKNGTQRSSNRKSYGKEHWHLVNIHDGLAIF